jgi:very-short-patch-repair endonuclease
MARRRARDDRAYAHHEKVELARALRRPLTPAEQVLWSALRGKQLGVRARVQHVIRGWIVDFYLPAARLVVEVDGDVHDLQIAEDERRTEALRAEGLTVLRARNEEVFDDLPGVLRRIEQAIVPSAAR